LKYLITSTTLAKVNLLSPVILENIVVREITNEHITNVSVAHVLAVSNVKIFQNYNLLYFLVKFPKPKVAWKKLMIYPVQHNNVILDLGQHNTIADCGELILAVSNCDIAVGTTFCKTLESSTCAQQLMTGVLAHCDTKSSHLQSVVKVDEGMLLQT